MLVELMHCPMCHEKVGSFATCRTDQPFTAKEPLEGLEAWGAYDMPKEMLCFDGKYVHFRFLDDGETRLVELKPFDLEAIRDAQYEQANEHHACEHEGCPNAGEPYYLRMYDEEVNMWLCPDHAYEHGFCSSCHLFNAGFESFDFSPSHLCAACVEDIERELYDGGDDLDFGY